MSSKPNEVSTDKLSVSDPTLAFLASQAAIELDNRLLGRQTEMVAVGDLARRLERSTEPVSEGACRQSLMDPSTVSLVSDAIVESNSTPVHNLAELASAAWAIANELQSFSDTGDKSDIERLRNFCIYLAQGAVAHERSFFEGKSATASWS